MDCNILCILNNNIKIIIHTFVFDHSYQTFLVHTSPSHKAQQSLDSGSFQLPSTSFKKMVLKI